MICRDQSGELIAFQLKGNPSSRFTMSQWHQIYPQILQLVTAPIRGLLSGGCHHHTPVLVTNGEVEEDVQSAISSFNADFLPHYPHSRKLEIWNRGKLVALFAKVSRSAWPVSIQTQISVMKSAIGDGRETISAQTLQEVSEQVFFHDSERAPSTQKSLERASAFATLIGVIISQHVQRGNLYEAIRAKSIGIALVAGYFDRFGFSSRRHLQLFRLMRSEIITFVESFSVSVAEKYSDRPMVNDDVTAEFAVMHPRRMLVTAILAIMLLELRRVDRPLRPEHSKVLAAVRRDIDYPFLLGEFIVPSFLAVFWAKERTMGTMRPDIELISVLRGLVLLSRKMTLHSPYLGIEEVVPAANREFIGELLHDIDFDNRRNMSQFAFSLACMLAKRNWKQTVKNVWPELTRIAVQETRLQSGVEFGFSRSTAASESTSLLATPQSWDGLLRIATLERQPSIPSLLQDDPILVLLVTLFLPFRCTTDVVLWLDRKLASTWY